MNILRKILPVIFLSSFQMALSQNYLPFSSERISHFYSSAYNTIFSFRPDSISILGGDTIFFNYKQFIATENTGNYLSSTANAQCIFYSDTSWLGIFVLSKFNGDFLWFSKNNDTILLKTKAQLWDDWVFFKINANLYLHATIIKMDTMAFLGLTDSVKIIHLTARDSTGNNIPHPFSTKEIILSKNHGVVNFFDMLYFPEDVSDFSLIGHTEPEVGIQNLIREEIFDFNVGDEIHTYLKSITNWSMPWVYFDDYTRIVYFSKSFSANNDTVFYTAEREFLGFHNNTQVVNIDTTYFTDTISFIITLAGNEATDRLSFEPVDSITQVDQNGYVIWNFTTFCGKRKRQKWLYPYYYFGSSYAGDSCWNMIIMDPYYPTYQYIEGLGGSYTNNENIVFYKKGFEECGTPINFQSLLNSAIAGFENNEIKVFFNSESKSIYINSSFKDLKFELFDVLGRLVFTRGIKNQQNMISLNIPYNTGIYFYTVRSAGKTFSGKILLH